MIETLVLRLGQIEAFSWVVGLVGNVLDLLTRLLDWSRKFITIHE